MTGKPSKDIIDLIMKQNNIEESERDKFLMIGDNPETDIALGNNAGIDSCLVLTGFVKNIEDAEKWAERSALTKPTHVVESFGDPFE